MAWLNNNSVISFGKYKGKKVSSINDSDYIKKVHESHLNVFFTEDVFKRLGVKHEGKTKQIK